MEQTEGTSALKQDERFTLEQRRSWPEDERWEIIGGVAYNMSAAPSVCHQDYVGTLFIAIGTFLQGKPCKAYLSPLDVFLSMEEEDTEDTVVEPDILVVCDSDKIREDGIHGGPDFIAEVLSPSTAYKDLTAKQRLYEASGVREYWLVNPESGSVFVYLNREGRFGSVTEYLRGQDVPSVVMAGFSWKNT
jgi:Uma2 family endonuclease